MIRYNEMLHLNYEGGHFISGVRPRWWSNEGMLDAPEWIPAGSVADWHAAHKDTGFCAMPVQTLTKRGA